SNTESEAKDRLPAPEQMLLRQLSHEQIAELIERHIDFVHISKEGIESVHLPANFVRHFRHRPDDKTLARIRTIITLPIILPDGKVLAQSRGVNREHGIAFHIPPELMNLLPKLADCDREAVREAMNFLTDEWLCDVATDYQGKMVLIATTL